MTHASHGLQHWLESKAAGPAFLIAALSIILRGAPFWSGGAINLSVLLGHAGVQWFNGLTGVGIAFGAELLASVAGRQWQHAEAERLEATTRPRITKAERASLDAHYAAQATLAKRYMVLGLVASFVAAAFFLATTTGVHSLLSLGAAADALIAGILVAVMSWFGIFYQDRPDADAAEVQTGQARALKARAVAAAAERVASGTYTAQDVRLSGSALPRSERDGWEAALIVSAPDDPTWTTAELADWLGCNDQAGRKRLQRQLSRLKSDGVGVVKDERIGYLIPRSIVAMHFAKQYIAAHTHATPATLPGHSQPSGPLAAAATADSDATATGERQDAESTRYVTNVAV